MKSTIWLISYARLAASAQLIHRSFTRLSLTTFSIETSRTRLCSRPLVSRTSTPWCVARSYADPVMCRMLCTTVLLQVLSMQESPLTSTVRWLSGCPIHTLSLRLYNYTYVYTCGLISVQIDCTHPLTISVFVSFSKTNNNFTMYNNNYHCT